MTHTRLDAGFSGVTALLMTCLACTSLQELSSYSAGSSDGAAAPDSQPTAPSSSGDEAPPPTPDAGAPAPPAVEAQNPTDVPLSPPDSVDDVDADDCTGPGEFTDPGGFSCYQLSDTLGPWRDARDLCQAWGGDLAKVESVEENTLLGARSDRDVWLGASDFEDEGNFRWFDGDDVDPDGSWAPAQPDNYEGSENCLELRAMDNRWNDVPCTSEKVALCERALGGDGAE
jgi:hypothetical protein